jgi:hypothetical protein
MYTAFKTPRVEYGLTAEPLTLEEVRAVATSLFLGILESLPQL